MQVAMPQYRIYPCCHSHSEPSRTRLTVGRMSATASNAIRRWTLGLLLDCVTTLLLSKPAPSAHGLHGSARVLPLAYSGYSAPLIDPCGIPSRRRHEHE